MQNFYWNKSCLSPKTVRDVYILARDAQKSAKKAEIRLSVFSALANSSSCAELRNSSYVCIDTLASSRSSKVYTKVARKAVHADIEHMIFRKPSAN